MKVKIIKEGVESVCYVDTEDNKERTLCHEVVSAQCKETEEEITCKDCKWLMDLAWFGKIVGWQVNMNKREVK